MCLVGRGRYIEYHGLGFVPPSFVSHEATPGIRLMDCFNNTFRALRFRCSSTILPKSTGIIAHAACVS